MRTIGVVTVARSDYGIYLSLLRKIAADPDLRLRLIVGGMHLSPLYGLTVKDIESDGFPIAERVAMLEPSDEPQAIAQSIGRGVIGFSQAYARHRPDLLVVLGDRFEMYSAALAALPFKLPLAHIHGGELTEGAIDDALRHSMTKLSHLHFVATQEYARRVEQLGEEPWRITVSGAPSLDNLHSMPLLDRAELESRLNVKLSTAPLLVTYHPVTLEYEQTAWQVKELLAALDELGLPVVFTMPNADTHSHVIVKLLQQYVQTHPSARLVENMGAQAYFSLMSIAAAMVGNSSSGIIEAPSVGLPVVNIGTRQQGRVRAANVIDVGYERREVAHGIRRALASEFRSSLKGLANPCGDGHSAERILRRLKDVPLDDRLIMKRFVDIDLRLPTGRSG